MKILQIVGFKNSGKTTLINQLISISNSLNVKVATIKHHGHGIEDISLNHHSVDSVSFIDQGAIESVTVGHAFIEHIIKKETKTLEEIIHKQIKTDPHLILIEGFKYNNYEKVVLLDDKSEVPERLNNVIYTFNAKNKSELEQFIIFFNKWIKEES